MDISFTRSNLDCGRKMNSKGFSMKRKIVISGLCLFALLSAGWVLRLAAKQQTRKINTAPAPPLRVEPAKESDVTGKTVAAAKAFLATLDDAARARSEERRVGKECRSRW